MLELTYEMTYREKTSGPLGRVPEFEVGDERYAWLNREIEYEIFRVD